MRLITIHLKETPMKKSIVELTTEHCKELSYRYFVDKGISPLEKETKPFFSRLTNPLVVCFHRKVNSDLPQSTK